MFDFIINHINQGWTLRIYTVTKQAAICFKFGNLIDVDYNQAIKLLDTADQHGFTIDTLATLANYYEIHN